MSTTISTPSDPSAEAADALRVARWVVKRLGRNYRPPGYEHADVVQEGVLSYFRALRTERFVDWNRAKWVVVTRDLMDLYRDTRDDWTSLPPDAPVPDNHWSNDPLNKLIADELFASLPENARRIAELKVFAHLTNREVGEELGLNPSTVQLRLRKAKEILECSRS